MIGEKPHGIPHAVLKALRRRRRAFSSNDITACLEPKYGYRSNLRDYVSTFLSKLSREGYIETAGTEVLPRGGVRNVYKRKS